MEDQIQVFDFDNRNVRIVELNGEPWFVLKDVCTAMEIEQVAGLRRRLTDDVILNHLIPDALGRQQDTMIINEDGLYDVILESRKPKAKAFRKWVTRDVLPTIRKTGTYRIQPSAVAPVVEKLDKQKQLQMEIRRINAESKLLQVRLDQSKEIVQLATLMKDQFSKQDTRRLLYAFLNTISPYHNFLDTDDVIQEEIKQVLLEMPNADLTKFMGAVELITANRFQLSRQKQ